MGQCSQNTGIRCIRLLYDYRGGKRVLRFSMTSHRALTSGKVITGLPPFPHLQAGTAVIAAVYLRNERPEKSPMNSGDGVSYENAWKVAEAGWLTLCEDRIPMAEAFCRLSKDPSLL